MTFLKFYESFQQIIKLKGGFRNPLKMQLVSKLRAVLWQLLLFICTTLIEVRGKIQWGNHNVDPLEFWRTIHYSQKSSWNATGT